MYVHVYICCDCYSNLKNSNNNFEVVRSTSEFEEDRCDVCNVDEYEHTLCVEVLSESHEECDCYERYGRTMHCNGGNYHLSSYIVQVI